MLNQRGVGLIELLLAMSLGLLVLGSACSLLLSALISSRVLLDRMRFDQDLRGLDIALQRDIARAGYWQAMDAVAFSAGRFALQVSATQGSVYVDARLDNVAAPAFAAPLTSAVLGGRRIVAHLSDRNGNAQLYTLRIDQRVHESRLLATIVGTALPATALPPGSWTIDNPFIHLAQSERCIVFGYDEDQDGRQIAQERFGYRLDPDEHALEGTNNANTCDTGTWQNLSDERVVSVAALQLQMGSFVIDAGNGLSLRHAGVRLSIEAQLRSQSAQRRSVVITHVRNAQSG